MARWSRYRFTERDGTVSHSILEQLSSGSTYYTLDGASFVVPVPARCELVNDGIARPAWGHDDPAPDPAPLPPYLTSSRLRKSLHAIGKLSGVPVAIATLSEPRKTHVQIEWDCETRFERDHPLIKSLRPALGMTNVQMDDVFRDGEAF